MVFSSLLFTFLFLPVTLLFYYLGQERYRNYILLAASLLFYAYGEPWFVFVMLASIAVNYGLALAIDAAKRAQHPGAARAGLIAAVTVNVGLLFVFKYFSYFAGTVNGLVHGPWTVPQIALPIGISFFTFQALSYVIDVWRGTAPVQKNPFYLALYISFFPQLIAGPIVRYASIEAQLRSRRCTPELFAEGARRFFLGFGKKVLLANQLAIVAEDTFSLDAAVTQTNPLLLWLGSVCYTLQIYYDFSGYSDMAIGLGRLFGFRFEENFNYPYIARSVTDFWRRWHISLGQWFRDYVYFPLGGSRVRVPRHIFNLFVVWALTGIWHGANLRFLVWGLGYFVLLVVEKYFVHPERRGRLLRAVWRAVTLLCVNFGWVIFNAQGLANGLRYCLGMLGVYGVRPAPDAQVLFFLREYGVFLLLGLVCATPLLRRLGEWAERRPASAAVCAVARPLAYGLMFLWAVSFLILGAHNPFIYFNF